MRKEVTSYSFSSVKESDKIFLKNLKTLLKDEGRSFSHFLIVALKHYTESLNMNISEVEK